MTLEEAKKQITPLNTRAMEEAVAHWNRIESWMISLFSLRGSRELKPKKLKKETSLPCAQITE